MRVSELRLAHAHLLDMGDARSGCLRLKGCQGARDVCPYHPRVRCEDESLGRYSWRFTPSHKPAGACSGSH